MRTDAYLLGTVLVAAVLLVVCSLVRPEIGVEITVVTVCLATGAGRRRGSDGATAPGGVAAG